MSEVPRGLPADPRRGGRARAMALVVAATAVPVAVPIASVLFAVTTFLFHFSGGQYRMGTIVAAGPFVAIAAALVVGSITAWRTAEFGRAFAMMMKATGVAWALLVPAEWLLSFAFGA